MIQKKRIDDIEGLYLIESDKHGDDRGWFMELVNNADLAKNGLNESWSQTNMSHSTQGVFRGLHCQYEPFGQIKLLRVIRGSIIDVVVDIREKSPTYGQVAHVVLAQPGAEGGRAIYVPAGFAHGFVVLSAEADVMYHVSRPYAPKAEFGINWRSPGLDILSIFEEYGLREGQLEINDRDNSWPMFKK